MKVKIKSYPLQTTRILGSIIIVMSLIFIIMFMWLATQAPLMLLILSFETELTGHMPTKGDWTITILKIVANYWGIIAIASLLVTYGIWQAQKRDYRGETFY